MLFLDLRHAFGPLQFIERLALAPREWRAMLERVFFVALGFLEEVRMPLHQPHPFNLLLKEAERTAAAGPPLVVFGEA